MALLNGHSTATSARIPVAQRTATSGAFKPVTKATPKAVGGFKLATDLNGLLAQRSDPKNAMNRGLISTAIAKARTAPAAPTTTPAAPVAPGAPTTPAVSGPLSAPPMEAPVDNFRTTQSFIPKDLTGDPAYVFQLKQGQDQLAKSLAARGLSN